MKYCPFCGAGIPAADASFCGACGKALPVPTPPPAVKRPVPRPPGQPVRKHTAPPPGKTPRPAPPRQPTSGKPKRQPSPGGQTPPPPAKEKSRRRDTGYDGYYDDVTPADSGKLQEGPDRELVKGIIWVVVGAIGVIGLAVAVMLLL